MNNKGLIMARRMRVSSKIMLTLFPILLIPCLIGAALWLKWKTDGVYTRFDNEAAAVLSELRSQTAGNAELVSNSALIALNRRSFLEFCTGDMDADGLALVKFAQNELQDMRYIFQSNPLISEASFYFENDGVYEIWPLVYNADRLENTALESLDLRGQSGVYVTDAEVGEISCCYAVYLDVTRIGMLVLRINIEPFLSGLYQTMPETANSVALLPADGGGCFTSDREALPGTESILLAISESASGTLEFEYGGSSYYGAAAYLPLLDSWAVVLTELETPMSGPRAAMLSSLCVFALAAILLWLLVHYVCRRLLRRLSSLEDNMLRVQGGDLTVRIPERGGGGDELDTLAHTFNRMLDRTQELMDENVERSLAATRAELNALQSQINSHFLYNALESIRMMAEIRGEPGIADTIVSLGSLLRYHMTWKDRTVTLREELDCVHRYVHFCRVTGEAELVLEDCVSGGYLDCEIPKLSIQPLVENAINHGLPSGHGRLHIRISCSNEAGWLKVCVENDGCGISAERLEAIRRALDGGGVEPLRKERNGIGIVNVHQRLVMSYGEGSGLRLESGETGGVRAYVILPYNGTELGGW